jgi:hypothetical protein
MPDLPSPSPLERHRELPAHLLALRGLWEWLRNNTTLALTCATAFGVACGYLALKEQYQRNFGILPTTLGLSLFDYLLYGFLPLGIQLLLLALMFVGISNPKRRSVTIGAILLGVALTLVPKALVERPNSLVVNLMVIGTCTIVVAMSRLLRFLLSKEGAKLAYGVTLSSFMSLIVSVTNGEIAAMLVYTRSASVTVRTDNMTLADSLKDCDLALITHSAGTWYFVDRKTPFAAPTVHAIPDSQVLAVETTKQP